LPDAIAAASDGRLFSTRIIQHSIVAIVVCTLISLPSVNAAPSLTEATEKARSFLVGLLDPDLGLLPEYRGSTVYWLFHDNYLAVKVLSVSHPAVAQTIRSALQREGVFKSGSTSHTGRRIAALKERLSHYCPAKKIRVVSKFTVVAAVCLPSFAQSAQRFLRAQRSVAMEKSPASAR